MITEFIKQNILSQKIVFSNKKLPKGKNLVIENYKDCEFISQQSYWSSCYELPCFDARILNVKMVFEELMAEMRITIPKFALQEILSGHFCFIEKIFALNPRKDIIYTVVFNSGTTVNDGIGKHFVIEPSIRVNLNHHIYHIDDTLYLLQQLHLLQGIFLSFWRRSASMSFSEKKLKISPSFNVWRWETSKLKKIQELLDNRFKSRFYIKSNTKFDDLSWDSIVLI